MITGKEDEEKRKRKKKGVSESAERGDERDGELLKERETEEEDIFELARRKRRIRVSFTLHFTFYFHQLFFSLTHNSFSNV